MRRFTLLIITTVLLAVSGFATEKSEQSQKSNSNAVEVSSQNTRENFIILGHKDQIIDMGVSLPVLPPVQIKGRYGGPVFFMEYTLRFNTTENGTQMIISCELVKQI